MKKITLPNGSTVFSLSEKEEAIAKDRIPKYQELRRDTIEDEIYKKSVRFFILYRTTDNKLLFDYGQNKFLILPDEKTYDYYLSNERLYQTFHSMDFVNFEAYRDFISTLNGLVDAFCSRTKTSKDKLDIGVLQSDIINTDKSYNYIKQHTAVLCFLKSKQGFDVEYLELSTPDPNYVITMINKEGKRITPAQLIANMYEKHYLK